MAVDFSGLPAGPLIFGRGECEYVGPLSLSTGAAPRRRTGGLARNAERRAARAASDDADAATHPRSPAFAASQTAAADRGVTPRASGPLAASVEWVRFVFKVRAMVAPPSGLILNAEKKRAAAAGADTRLLGLPFTSPATAREARAEQRLLNDVLGDAADEV